MERKQRLFTGGAAALFIAALFMSGCGSPADENGAAAAPMTIAVRRLRPAQGIAAESPQSLRSNVRTCSGKPSLPAGQAGKCALIDLMSGICA